VRRLGFFFISILIFTTQGADADPGDWSIYLDASAVNRITCVGDSLWCGTNGGILLFDLTDSTMTQYYSGLQLRSNEVSAIAVDPGGAVWAGFLGTGIARIEDLAIDPIVSHYNEKADLMLGDSINCLLSIDEDIYYGCQNGIAKFFNKVHSLEPNLSESLSGKRVNDLLIDNADLLWIAYEDGVARFNRVTLILDIFPVGYTFSITFHEGMIYAATSAGIMRYGGASWEEFGTTFHNGLLPLSIDSGGEEIYAATAERAYRYNGAYWQSMETAQMKAAFAENYRINDYHLRAIAVDDNGTPWIGGRLPSGSTRGSYITGLIDTRWTNKAIPNLSQNDISALDASPGGNVWVSTHFGINYRSGDGEWIKYREIRADVGNDDAISYFGYNLALLHDTQNHLWCNSMDYDLDMIDLGDIFNKDDDIWAHFSIGDGNTITTNRFVKAREDPEGNRWFLSDDVSYAANGMWGINVIDRTGSNWLEVNPLTHSSMNGGNIFDCAFSQFGVYLGIKGYGVQYWQTGGFAWSTLTSPTGDIWATVLDESNMNSTEIAAIEVTEDGTLWAGTGGGLVRYREGVVEQYREKGDDSNYGLIGLDVKDIELDGYGNLWVATNKGLNRIDPDGLIDRAFTTAVFWEENVQPYYPESVISPLPSHNCLALSCDVDENLLWIGTDRGVACLDLRPPDLQRLHRFHEQVHLQDYIPLYRPSRISARSSTNYPRVRDEPDWDRGSTLILEYSAVLEA